MSGICQGCARRAWLLAKLGSQLDRAIARHDQSSFWSVLELPDLELIDAIGRHRRAELHAAYTAWQPAQRCWDEQPQALCRHHAAFPRSLHGDTLSPHSFELRGGVEQLRSLLDGKVVAIVGTRRASDYGMEVARGLARGLAASGVAIASDFAEGIASAALAGALEADGALLSVMSASVERCTPAWRAPLYRRVLEHGGCSIAECRTSSRTRRWWSYANARTLALLAQLVIVVEATEEPEDLACANVALSRARHVAAVPGRIISPGSRGTNRLLMNGARLVRGSQDALDVLYGVGIYEANDQPLAHDLQPRLANVLELIGDGQDTPAKLVASGTGSEEVAVALAELELRGLLARGDGGRYLPCASVLTGERSRRIRASNPVGRTI